MPPAVASGLLTTESFTESVKAQLENGDGEKGELSYIGHSGIRDVFARLDEEGQEGLLRRLGILLKSYSQGGDAAAQPADDRFGLLHDPNLDLETVEGQITEFVRHADPKGVGVAVKTNTVGVESLDLKGEDAAQAIVYNIQQVAQAAPGTDISKVLSSGLQEQVHKAADKIAVVKSVIASKEFDVAYQAIVSLEDRAASLRGASSHAGERPENAAVPVCVLRGGGRPDHRVRPCHVREGHQSNDFRCRAWRRASRGSEYFWALHRFLGVYRKAARVACRR